MQKTSISIISQEGRQKFVSWEFTKVISLKLSSPQIHLPQTRMPAIIKIIEYAHHHNFANQLPVFTMPLEAYDMKDIVKNEWDCSFFASLSVDVLIDIINTCEFLGYKSLSLYSQAYLSTLFNSLNIEELKETFGVDEDFDEKQAQAGFDDYMKKVE